jgi:hypothetical protein
MFFYYLQKFLNLLIFLAGLYLFLKWGHIEFRAATPGTYLLTLLGIALIIASWSALNRKQPRKETHFSKEVWVSPAIETLRPKECLCMNCKKLKPNQADNCRIAQRLYGICVKENTALAVTRCPEFLSKSSL